MLGPTASALGPGQSARTRPLRRIASARSSAFESSGPPFARLLAVLTEPEAIQACTTLSRWRVMGESRCSRAADGDNFASYHMQCPEKSYNSETNLCKPYSLGLKGNGKCRQDDDASALQELHVARSLHEEEDSVDCAEHWKVRGQVPSDR